MKFGTGEIKVPICVATLGEIIATLRAWKCPQCGGRKTYIPRCPSEGVVTPCRKCEGTGLEPRSRAMLDKLGSTYE